jgi:hypothetical protein
MGLRWRGVLRCGACGKPRGLGSHLCKPGNRTRRRTKVQRPVAWECSTCHQPRGLVHTSHVSTDFKARRRKQATAERQRKRRAVKARQTERRKQAKADRRARAQARKPAPKRPPRPRGESHEPGTCGNRECPRYGCKAYWSGMESCPLPHGGGE